MSSVGSDIWLRVAILLQFVYDTATSRNRTKYFALSMFAVAEGVGDGTNEFVGFHRVKKELTVVNDVQRRRVSASDFRIHFPPGANEYDQDEEWFEFETDAGPQRLRIHDYAELYSVPGLYEALVYDKLKCNSPKRLASLLANVLTDWPREPSDLRVLDLGAGNGIVAEEIRKHGVNHVVGLDLLPEAKMSAERDRPQVYNDYFVTDICNPSDEERRRLEDHKLNCLVTVAALGFGDIPPDAFAAAFNLIETEGWLAMTIKEEFLSTEDQSGFARFVRAILESEIADVQAHQRYCHRRSIGGEQLFYIALVARKTSDIPASLLEDIAAGDDLAAASTADTDAATQLLMASKAG